MKKFLSLFAVLFVVNCSFGQIYEVTLKISDGFTNDTLRIGYDPTATNGIDQHLGEFELPPPPPTGVFDTRIFSDSANVPLGQGVKRDYRPGQFPISLTTYHKIKFQPGTSSQFIRVTLLRFSSGVQGYQELNIKDFFGGILYNSTIIAPDTGSVLITNFGIVGLILTLKLMNLSPVELTSFYSLVNTNDVQLHWTTGAEVNNRGFEIHRKLNTDEHWMPIGFVEGKGNSNALNEYDYVDENLQQGRYSYRLKQIDLNGNFEYFLLNNEVVIEMPGEFKLHQNFPNPFNPVTTISYQIERSGNVTLKLYDLGGRLVKVLIDEHKNSGFYEYQFDGSSFSSGLYYYTLESGENVQTRSFVLMK